MAATLVTLGAWSAAVLAAAASATAAMPPRAMTAGFVALAFPALETGFAAARVMRLALALTALPAAALAKLAPAAAAPPAAVLAIALESAVLAANLRGGLDGGFAAEQAFQPGEKAARLLRRLRPGAARRLGLAACVPGLRPEVTSFAAGISLLGPGLPGLGSGLLSGLGPGLIAPRLGPESGAFIAAGRSAFPI